MDYVLKTNALCKSYKNYKALNGLSMNIPKGAIYGFVGKNGAHKSQRPAGFRKSHRPLQTGA